MRTRGGIVAILWAPHEERTAGFAKHLGASLHRIHYLRYKHPPYAPLKYPPQCLKTWTVLAREHPSYVFVMNPPVFAAWSVHVYCRLAGASMIMDTHPPALYSRKWGWSVPLQRALARRARMNIVDQQRFKDLFESWGAQAMVLTRPPITVPVNPNGKEVATQPGNVAVVNTFASDEPVEPILEAARQLPQMKFFVLGDTSRAKKSIMTEAPQNVVFTGYLTEHHYWDRLRASEIVMVLTTYPYSLLAGAQEGMSLGKPLVLSRQPALTEFFTQGTEFVDHSVASIVEGVRRASEHAPRLAQESAALALEKHRQWEANFQELQALVALG